MKKALLYALIYAAGISTGELLWKHWTTKDISRDVMNGPYPTSSSVPGKRLW